MGGVVLERRTIPVDQEEVHMQGAGKGTRRGMKVSVKGLQRVGSTGEGGESLIPGLPVVEDVRRRRHASDSQERLL